MDQRPVQQYQYVNANPPVVSPPQPNVTEVRKPAVDVEDIPNLLLCCTNLADNGDVCCDYNRIIRFESGATCPALGYRSTLCPAFIFLILLLPFMFMGCAHGMECVAWKEVE